MQSPLITRRVKINRLLVPTDFSSLAEEALEYAAYLAEVVKADITALHIVESGTFESDSKENDGQKERIHRLEQLWQELQKRRPIDPSIQFRARLKEGKIQDQILETALEEQSDLIVMGTPWKVWNQPAVTVFSGLNGQPAYSGQSGAGS